MQRRSSAATASAGALMSCTAKSASHPTTPRQSVAPLAWNDAQGPLADTIANQPELQIGRFVKPDV